MDRNRIPYVLDRFHIYICQADDYLHSLSDDGITPKGERLDMTVAELNKLSDFRNKWYTNDPANPGLYNVHINPNTKTPVSRKNVNLLMKEFRSFFRPVLSRIAVCRNIDSASRIILRISEPVSSRTQHRIAIAEYCEMKITPLMGGRLHMRCSTTTESGRGAKPRQADAVELAYQIVLPVFDANGKHISQGYPEIHECQHSTISTKTNFILDMGSEHWCKFIVVYARWINTRNPHMASPWSGPLRVVIC